MKIEKKTLNLFDLSMVEFACKKHVTVKIHKDGYGCNYYTMSLNDVSVEVASRSGGCNEIFGIETTKTVKSSLGNSMWWYMAAEEIPVVVPDILKWAFSKNGKIKTEFYGFPGDCITELGRSYLQ